MEHGSNDGCLVRSEHIHFFSADNRPVSGIKSVDCDRVFELAILQLICIFSISEVGYSALSLHPIGPEGDLSSSRS